MGKGERVHLRIKRKTRRGKRERTGKRRQRERRH
jgi:hypothetical protein